MFKVILLSEAEKFYKKLFHSDRSIFDRISTALISLQTEPFQGKALKHQLKGKHSLIAGNYKTIYKVEKKLLQFTF